MQYKTRPGDSPAIIARRHGISVAALMSANPHKSTTVVAGKRTWQGLHHNERLNMPAGVGALGDGDLGAITPAAPGAPHATIRQGSTGADVALWQTILGVTADGIFGPKTATATKAWQGTHGLAADGVVGPKTWAAALGGVTTAAATPAAPSTAPLPPPPGAVTPAAVQALLSFNPCDQANVALVCQAQSTLKVTVDGKYGAGTEAAARKLMSWAPAACTPRPAWWKPAGQSNCPGASVAPVAQTPQIQPIQMPAAPSGSAVPAAVQALVGINPCLQANSGTVFAAQTALGIKADGKYGTGTAAAVRALGISAPAACSPAPAWWGAKGTAAATQAVTTAAAAAPAAVAAHPVDQAVATANAAAAQAADAIAKAKAAATQTQADEAAATAKAAVEAAARAAAAATTQAQTDAANLAAKVAADALAAAAAKGGTAPGGNAITSPEAKKGLSTGAIVAGSIGAAALVGLLAVAAMGKKPGRRGSRGSRGARGPAKRRKPAKRSKRKSAKRKKR